MTFAKILYFAGGIAAAVIGWFLDRYAHQQDKRSERH
jgi:F0F1-type ATP synthase assembly protein I